MQRTAPLWRWIAARWRGWVLPGLAITLMIYTADQLFTGERGMVTWRVMRGQIADLNADNATLTADIARLNNHIDRLKGVRQPDGTYSSPDKDFIDEQLRQNLGVLKAGEAVILLNAKP
jgi:cell division protein FtsB